MTERWLDCECPVTGVDFDLTQIKSPDAMVHCSECGGEHRLGDIAQLIENTGDGGRALSEAAWRGMVGGSR